MNRIAMLSLLSLASSGATPSATLPNFMVFIVDGECPLSHLCHRPDLAPTPLTRLPPLPNPSDHFRHGVR